METIDLWILNFIIPITEMLTFLTFLYLFYFQAKSKIDSEKTSQDSKITSIEYDSTENIRRLYKDSTLDNESENKYKHQGKKLKKGINKPSGMLSLTTSINDDEN